MQAIEHYLAAVGFGLSLAQSEAAETWQFDLGDKARAIAGYQGALLAARRMRSTSRENERAFAIIQTRWLEHQLRYLRTGALFRGTLDNYDLARADGLVYVMSGARLASVAGLDAVLREVNVATANGTRDAIDQNRLRQALQEAPVAMSVLLVSPDAAMALDDPAEIRRFFARQDPAGYATAAYFMLVEITAAAAAAKLPSLPPEQATIHARYIPSAAALQAVRRFLRERGIAVDVSNSPRVQ